MMKTAEVDDALVSTGGHAELDIPDFGEEARGLPEGVDDFMVGASGRDD